MAGLTTKGGAKVTRPKMSDEQKAAEKADPSLRFKRLANKRVNACLKSLRVVGNLAGPGYSKGRSDENVAAILDAIVGEVNAVRAAFLKTKSEAQSFSI
jgi:hypothetical protein